MADYTLNKTTTLTTTMQNYYDRVLLENMKPKLVHTEFAQKKTLPLNSGKTVYMRKWTPFAALTTALTEAVVPDGQTLAQTDINATIQSYGGWVPVSDQLSMTAADPIIQNAVELMADQGGLTIDHITREVLHAGTTSIQYANAQTSRRGILSTNVLTTTELRKAVRTLKNAKAPMFSRNGQNFYIAIVHPDTVYDMQSDTTWQAVAQYQDKEKIFSGELGRVFGVVFVETTEAKQYTAPTLATNAVASYTSGTKTVTLDNALTAAEAAAIVEMGQVKIGATYQAVASASGTSIVLSGTISTAPTADDAVTGCGPGASGINLGATIVLGKNAYGVIELDGKNMHTIVKPHGSGGTSDPVDQIATVAWKVDGFVAKILQSTWAVQIFHGYTA